MLAAGESKIHVLYLNVYLKWHHLIYSLCLWLSQCFSIRYRLHHLIPGIIVAVQYWQQVSPKLMFCNSMSIQMPSSHPFPLPLIVPMFLKQIWTTSSDSWSHGRSQTMAAGESKMDVLYFNVYLKWHHIIHSLCLWLSQCCSIRYRLHHLIPDRMAAVQYWQQLSPKLMVYTSTCI